MDITSLLSPVLQTQLPEFSDPSSFWLFHNLGSSAHAGRTAHMTNASVFVQFSNDLHVQILRVTYSIDDSFTKWNGDISPSEKSPCNYGSLWGVYICLGKKYDFLEVWGTTGWLLQSHNMYLNSKGDIRFFLPFHPFLITHLCFISPDPFPKGISHSSNISGEGCITCMTPGKTVFFETYLTSLRETSNEICILLLLILNKQAFWHCINPKLIRPVINTLSPNAF